ncbi:MAG: type I 3-dehydroquinate dehydratase [Thermoanaerobaculia bacterium]
MARVLPIPAAVASLAPRTLEDARRLVSLVPARASAIECRLDLADAPIPPRVLLDLDSRPLIVTYRSLEEGGRFDGSAEEYRRLAAEAYEAGATVDLEHARGLLSDRSLFPDRERVVVSLHSPFALPGDFEARVSAMLATGSRAVKLVAGAGDLPASFRIASLQKGQPAAVSIFPMGPASPPGRVLSALFGASLVYGPVERETAGGQVPIADLLDVYEVDRPRAIDALFGIVGGSPKGSLSPLLYNALFRARGLSHLYVPLPVSDFDRESPHTIAFSPPLRGLAVTQPWKHAAARAGRPSEDVALTGAANTLVSGRRGWRAENTDVDGVFDPLADHDTGEGRNAVVLGAGGAARAAVVAARRLGYEVAVAARRDAEADRVAAALGVYSMAWEDVESSEADLYVNATPVGWRDEDPSAIPPCLFEARPLVFDCVYRRDGRETATIRRARAAGCPTVDGLRMLAAQAVRQASLFGLQGVSFEEVSGILRAGAVS